MHVLMTGGSGFLGRHLARALAAAGHTVAIVSRQPARVPGRAIGWEDVRAAMPGTDAVVHLAGASMTHRRWTAERKRELRESRVETAATLVQAIAAAAPRPAVLVSASAVGVYGNRGDEPLDEAAAPGDGFHAALCRESEAAASLARAHGVRVVALRFGLVLGNDGGVLPRMLPLFRAGLGGSLGGGRQWTSWIHRDDAIGLVGAALADTRYDGPVNAVAPTPVRQRELAAAVARAVGRPAFVPVPAIVLRSLLGSRAALLLTSQLTVPAAATAAGYAFRYPRLDAALTASVG